MQAWKFNSLELTLVINLPIIHKEIFLKIFLLLNGLNFQANKLEN